MTHLTIPWGSLGERQPAQRTEGRMNVHVHIPKATDRKLHRIQCPTCNRRTYAMSWFVPWYGWDTTCFKCGDAWQDGEMVGRPFRPRWRADRIARAKRRWRAGR